MEDSRFHHEEHENPTINRKHSRLEHFDARGCIVLDLHLRFQVKLSSVVCQENFKLQENSKCKRMDFYKAIRYDRRCPTVLNVKTFKQKVNPQFDAALRSPRFLSCHSPRRFSSQVLRRCNKINIFSGNSSRL